MVNAALALTCTLLVALVALLGISVTGMIRTWRSKGVLERAEVAGPETWRKTKETYAALSNKRPEEIDTGMFQILPGGNGLTVDEGKKT